MHVIPSSPHDTDPVPIMRVRVSNPHIFYLPTAILCKALPGNERRSLFTPPMSSSHPPASPINHPHHLLQDSCTTMAGSPNTSSHQPKVLARACQFCRSRKIKCDTERPSCGSCVAQRRDCVYKLQAPRERCVIDFVLGLKRLTLR